MLNGEVVTTRNQPKRRWASPGTDDGIVHLSHKAQHHERLEMNSTNSVLWPGNA